MAPIAPDRIVHFHRKHYEAVVAGTKVTTVRWREAVKVGPATFVFGDDLEATCVKGRVLAIESHRLSNLSAAAAHQPIGTDMEAFARELRANYYPAMPEDAEVDVVAIVADRSNRH